MKEIVLDLETQHAFGATRADPGRLKISLVGIYRYETDSYEAYREEELSKLWPIIEHADRIIGFNLFHFDYPVMVPYYPGKWQKFPTLDIFAHAEKTLGFRVGLDAIAQATLGHGKTGTGLDALKFYKAGKWKELEEYCLADVRVTREVYEHGLAHKKLKYSNSRGKGEFDVDFTFTKPERSINLSLPL